MEYVPLRDGYTFSGWYSDINLKTPYIFGSMPQKILHFMVNGYQMIEKNILLAQHPTISR
ncbi:InlB B-repeat-containing protein [Mycoplasmatota bacterium]|nr:InlB B-repeat-containing protein [Mycoplasmatota bacterium]